MRNWNIFFLVVLCGSISSFSQTPKIEGLHGRLEGEIHWSGEVVIDGDLEIAPKATLTIAPGTMIHMADRDVTQSGWNKKLVEIHVLGRVNITGSEEKPVRFLNSSPTGTWHGMVLQSEDKSAHPSVIGSAYFQGAVAAIQVPMGAPRISDCVFADCETAIEAGSAYASRRVVAIMGKLASPEIHGCRFTSCKTGVFAELSGSPDIRNCVFYRCEVGLGNSRRGSSYPLYDPGCIVERCAMIRNQFAVRGQALIRNSIFLDNVVAMRLSNFHAVYSTQVDHVAMQSNLFWKNRTRIQGDTGLDNTAITGNPAFVGPLDDLDAPGVALPDCLKLKPESAARKAGADGGDLGPFGQGVGQKDELRWETSGAKVQSFHLLPTMRDGQEVELKKALRGRPTSGKKVGKAWWISSNLGEQNELHIIETFGGSKVSAFLHFMVSGKKGEHLIELNGDVETVDVFVNGKEIAGLKTRRRFSSAGLILRLPLKSGTNRILLRIQTWGSRPRFACAVHGPARLGTNDSKPIEKLTGVKARLVESKGQRSIVVTTKSALNWSDTGKINIVEVLNARGRVELGTSGMQVEILGKTKLRISGLSRRVVKGMQLRLKGLHGPDGQEYPIIEEIPIR